jgi:hypothetical protein
LTQLFPNKPLGWLAASFILEGVQGLRPSLFPNLKYAGFKVQKLRSTRTLLRRDPFIIQVRAAGMEAELRGYLPTYRIGFVLPKLTRKEPSADTAFGAHNLLCTIFSQQS